LLLLSAKQKSRDGNPGIQIVDKVKAYLLLEFLTLKSSSKTVGVALQQLHFLCSDKENEAKENLSPSGGHVVRAVSLAASQSRCEIERSTRPPFGPEALEVLSCSGTLGT